MLFLLRIFVPLLYFYIFSYIFKINFKKFIFATIMGSFPGTLSISLFVSRVKENLISEGEININLLKDPYFIISLILIFFLVFIARHLKNKSLI